MTTPAPTQQMPDESLGPLQDSFEAAYIKAFELDSCHEIQAAFAQSRLAPVYIDGTTQAAWELWQSAHQCGREEERAENVAILIELQGAEDFANEETQDELQTAIERIQGDKKCQTETN